MSLLLLLSLSIFDEFHDPIMALEGGFLQGGDDCYSDFVALAGALASRIRSEGSDLVCGPQALLGSLL